MTERRFNTKIKDKHGREVHDGDLIRFSDGEIQRVEFSVWYEDGDGGYWGWRSGWSVAHDRDEGDWFEILDHEKEREN